MSFSGLGFGEVRGLGIRSTGAGVEEAVGRDSPALFRPSMASR